jgi:hypothetical protein
MTKEDVIDLSKRVKVRPEYALDRYVRLKMSLPSQIRRQGSCAGLTAAEELPPHLSENSSCTLQTNDIY